MSDQAETPARRAEREARQAFEQLARQTIDRPESGLDAGRPKPATPVVREQQK